MKPKRKQKKQKKENQLEKIIFDTIEKTANAAIQAALNDIFKEWK